MFCFYISRRGVLGRESAFVRPDGLLSETVPRDYYSSL